MQFDALYFQIALSFQVCFRLIVGTIMFSTVVFFSCEMHLVCLLVCTHIYNVESVAVLTESEKGQKMGSNCVNSCNPLVIETLEFLRELCAFFN